jgi:hypothetical protein
MYDHFWHLVLPLLRRLERVICTPYAWNEKGKRFVLIRNKKYAKRFKIVSYVIYANMVIIAWNLFQVFKKEPIATDNKFRNCSNNNVCDSE